jgi:drug/metabolite transporter (DMT)-like permease
MKNTGPLFALASALLFASGMPSAKFLLGRVDPTMLAGLLYLGSGAGLTLALLSRELIKKPEKKNFRRSDLGWLGASITVGGIMAPLMLMGAMTLARASAVSLLLNFEVVFTAVIAAFLFHEKLSVRVIVGLLAILLGGVTLSWSGNMTASWSLLLGLGACLFWSLDSNLAGQIVDVEPMRIAQLKGLVAGTVNIMLALILGRHFPEPGIIALAAVTGFLAYGISLTFFIAAMRRLGVARAMAYIATEPFIGSVLAVIFLHEPVSLNLCLAAVFMSIGVWLHLTEHHEHKHKDIQVTAENIVKTIND